MSLRTVKRSLLAILLGLAFGVQAFAQYGGSGGGSTGSTGVYTAPKGGYGSNGAAIGAAVAAGAAAGIGIGYLALRSHRTVVGCVEPSTDGVQLMNEKDQRTYALLAASVSLNPGERVALRGKKLKDDSGKPTFQVAKLVRDYGSCKQ